MADYLLSTLSTGAHLNFDPLVDVLIADAPGLTASGIVLITSGPDLGIRMGSKTLWFDGLQLSELTPDNLIFADGGGLVVGDASVSPREDAYGQDYSFLDELTGDLQVWGLGGGDVVKGGQGDDWLVGNGPMTGRLHLSRLGNLGGDGSSTSPTVSADGRFVGFDSGSTNLDGFNGGVYSKDLLTGTVTMEMRNLAGVAGLSGSFGSAMASDGRSMAFYSASGNLVPGPNSGALYDIYLAGVGDTAIERISVTSTGLLSVDGRNIDPDLSADARYVAFVSDSSNFATSTLSSDYDVFIKDRSTGELLRLSTSTAGRDGNGESRGVAISADGQFAVFESTANNLSVGDGNGYRDIFVWSRATNSLVNITAGANGVSSGADIAKDGDYGGLVVFESVASNLLPGQTTASGQIFVSSLDGSTRGLVSATAAGVAGNLSSDQASVSSDGRFVVFRSFADNLVAGDTNGVADIFVKDLLTGAIARVSNGAGQANQASSHPSISIGGEWIVFESNATNLASTDANGGFADVFRISNPLLFDTLIGGAGDDTYVLQRKDVIVELAGGGTDTVRSSISYALGANLENLVLLGAGNLNATGNSLNNVFTGNAGNNVMAGGAGIDTVSYASSTAAVTVDLNLTVAQATGAGNDTLLGIENLIGSRFNDRLTGNAGANRLDGGAGNDTLTGGAGNDTYVVNSSADVIVETSFLAGEINAVISSVNWVLQAGLANLTLTGSVATHGTGNGANNLITGNALANSLSGGAGNDTLNGGAGNDTLTGSTGNDTYIVDSSADVIVETSTVVGEINSVISAVNWVLQARLSNLTLTGNVATNGSGNSANNLITGNAVANTLSGAGGDDTLVGGGGNDTLIGSSGTDILTGGIGADQFRFDSTVGSDTVTDFLSGSDKLAFSQSRLALGDGDLLIEGGLLRAAPGGFSNSAELVVFSANAASLSTAAAAAVIGSATAGFTLGRTALFAVDNGVDSGLYRFVSSGTDALVSAAELTLIGTLQGRPATALTDYLFVA